MKGKMNTLQNTVMLNKIKSKKEFEKGKAAE